MMRYVFGDYSLDTQCYEFHHAGEPTPLQPKAFQVLAYLLVHRDRVVLKQELLEHLWPDQFVGDAALNCYIMAVRQAIGDSGQAQRCIRTIRGRGYRFVAPVTVWEPAMPVEEPSPPLPAAPGHMDAPGPPAVPPTAAVSSSADGEYKPVTVLCCALADAPALAACLGSEAMYHVMQALLTLTQEVIQRYNGTLTHVTGEGFTALFGAPVAQEDHARRAVLAAILLRQHLGELPVPDALRHESSLAIRTGIHTGQVVVGPLPQAPSYLYTAVGSTARLAALLQQRATPGTILISAATWQLVQEEVQAAADGTIAVDGIPRLLSVYAVQGLIPRRAGVVGHGTRHQSPFVGRERELALLHACLDQAVQGRGQVVGISGESGMGKSRLLEEFRRSLTEQPVIYYIGHCLPYGQTTPYLPVQELLRQCCGLTEMDDAAAITSKVQQYLCETGLAPEEEAPWLLQLLDVPGAATPLDQLDSQVRKARTFALSHHIILHTCHRQPLILAVENLQWIDATSEAWLAALVERLTGASLLLLASYRPGYRPPWLEQSMATQVALPGLLPQESLAVVHAVPGPAPLPRHLAQEIVTKAAGNPFFLEELAWTVATHGDRHTALPLPDTVQAVLAARIDRLPPAAKRLLQIAAVIGMEVPVPLLHAVVEVPEEALHRDLVPLQATEFLYETRLFPVREYAFKHTLTHDVTYGSLLQERRRVLHGRIIAAIEGLYADRLTEQVERLAHHALRGEVWDKALVYCRQAGAKAFARSALREAVAYFEQALVALAHLPERRDTLEQAIDLRFDLFPAMNPLEEYARVFDHLRVAETLAERLGDAWRLGRIASSLCSYFTNMGEHDSAIAAGQRAFTLATTSGVSDVQVIGQTPLGAAYYTVGDFRQALDYARRTMALFTGELCSVSFGQSTLPAVGSRRTVALSLAELGDFAEGHSMGEDALRIAEAAEQPFSTAMALMTVGVVYYRQGDIRTAVPVLERGLALCQTANFPRLVPLTASFLGVAYTLAGCIAEARPLLDQTLERVATGSSMLFHALVLTGLSEALFFVSHMHKASALAERLLKLSHTHIGRGYQAHAYRLLGDIAAHRHPPEVEKAQAHYFQALTLAEEVGMRPLQAHCHRGLGTLYAATGRQEQARAALATAIDLYRAMDMTFWLPQAEATLAQVEGGCTLDGTVTTGYGCPGR